MRLRGLLLLLPISLTAIGQWEIKTDLFPEQGNIDVYYDRKGNHAMSLQLNLDKNVYELWGSTYVYADDPELE